MNNPKEASEISVQTKQGEKLGTTPLGEVYAHFAHFIPPYPFRGGEHRKNVQPYHKAVTQCGNQQPMTADDYHVESSFTPEQRRFISTTAAYLNALAQGKVFDQTADVKEGQLSDRIHDHMLALDYLSYQWALKNAILALITDFANLYPNLTPALYGLFIAGGSAGTAQAIRFARNDLENAVSGLISNENVDKVKVAPHDYFIGLNPHCPIHSPSHVYKYEVWCSGETFAQTILKHSRTAALSLSQVPRIRHSYVYNDSTFPGESPTDLINEHIRAIASKLDIDTYQ